MGRLRVSRVLAFGLALAITLLLRPSNASIAFGYNGIAAATWADNHALSYDCNVYHCVQTGGGDADCTNFISWALKLGGGYPMHIGTGVENDDHNWWADYDGLHLWVTSFSWTYVAHQEQFQLLHSPGGWLTGSSYGTATNSYTGLSQGDLIAYDWDGNHTYTHMAIQTSPGKDLQWSSSQVGDRVDAHSVNRLRVWWTLSPYNTHRNTTLIQFMHISSSN